MDIHPLVIHYPIALLTLYSLFELVSFGPLREKPCWFHVKAIFVSLGALGAFATGLSGEAATNFIKGDVLVEMHLSSTYLATAIFGGVAGLYLAAWFGGRQAALKAGKIIFDRWVMVPLALGGLLSVMLLGAFAGAAVYGTRFDPFLAPVFKILNVY